MNHESRLRTSRDGRSKLICLASLLVRVGIVAVLWGVSRLDRREVLDHGQLERRLRERVPGLKERGEEKERGALHDITEEEVRRREPRCGRRSALIQSQFE